MGYTPYTKYLLMLLEVMDNRPDFKRVEFNHEEGTLDIVSNDGDIHVCFCDELRRIKEKRVV